MICKVTITRPNDTTAYSTGDVINQVSATTPALLKYEDAGKNLFAINSHLISSNPSGTPAIDVYLYSETFAIAADNAAFNPTDSQNKDYFLGKISHSTWTAQTANKHSSAKPDAPIAVTSRVEPGTGIYAVFVASAAYTPTANEEITLKLDVSF